MIGHSDEDFDYAGLFLEHFMIILKLLIILSDLGKFF